MAPPPLDGLAPPGEIFPRGKPLCLSFRPPVRPRLSVRLSVCPSVRPPVRHSFQTCALTPRCWNGGRTGSRSRSRRPVAGSGG
eukprot:COSAG02_NODE_181_length_30783_cov_53.060520_23_plen_83_part_00